MATPPLKVECAFASAPLSTSPVWTDITAYCSALGWSRGRANEFSEAEAGEATLSLDNSDGRFTPLNGAGPYWPNIAPRRKVRISADLGAGYEVLGTYFTTDPSTIIPATGDDVRSEWKCYDGFTILNRKELRQALVEEFLNAVTPGGSSKLYAVLPTNEESGTLLSDVGPNSRHGSIRAGRSVTGATVTLGADPIIKSGMQTLSFTKGTSGAAGYAALVPVPPQVRSASGYSVVFTVQIPAGETGIVAAVYGTDGQPILTLTPTAHSTGNTTGLSAQAIPNFADGKTHLIAVSWTNDDDGAGGGTASSTTVKIDNGTPSVAISDKILLADAVSLMGTANRFTSGSFVTGKLSGIGVYSRTEAIVPSFTVGTDVALLNAAGESDDARLRRILRYAGWPVSSAWITSAATKSTMSEAGWDAGSSSLSLLKEVARGCGGDVVIGKDGELRYESRQLRLNLTPTPIDSAKFGTADGLEFAYDSDVYTEVTGQRVGGSESTVSDPSAANTYGVQSDSFTSGVTSDDEVRNMAAWRLRWRKRPLVRCSQLSLDIAANGATTAEAAALIRLTFGSRATYDGLSALAPVAASTLDFFIEKVTHRVSPNGSVNTWVVEFDISPALARNSRAFVLDDANYGRIGGMSVSTAAMSSSATTIIGNGAIPADWPALPFAAFIDEEPVTVTALSFGASTTTFTVTRTAPIGHEIGAEIFLSGCAPLSN